MTAVASLVSYLWSGVFAKRAHCGIVSSTQHLCRRQTQANALAACCQPFHRGHHRHQLVSTTKHQLQARCHQIRSLATAAMMGCQTWRLQTSLAAQGACYSSPLSRQTPSIVAAMNQRRPLASGADTLATCSSPSSGETTVPSPAHREPVKAKLLREIQSFPTTLMRGYRTRARAIGLPSL